MRRLLLWLAAILAGMVLLISLVMTLVPAEDTLTTKRYMSQNGFQFDYPRGWNELDMTGMETELSDIYLSSGYLLDCVFAPGLFSEKSMCVYMSPTDITMADMKYFTDDLLKTYEEAGYEIDIIGAYSRFGEHLYYTIRCRANGRDLREYIIISGDRMYSFVFSGCADGDVEGILSSVSFFVDEPSESV